jgi:hypothetical protein
MSSLMVKTSLFKRQNIPGGKYKKIEMNDSQARPSIWILLSFIVLLFYYCANTIHCLEVISESISGDVKFSYNTEVYEITAPIVINGTLTVEPGVTVMFHKGASLTVYNGINAAGNVSAPITFTSTETAPSIGDWGRLIIHSYSASSIIKYVNFEYGGSGGCQVEYYGANEFHFQDSTMKNIVSDGLCLSSTGMCHNINTLVLTLEYRSCIYLFQLDRSIEYVYYCFFH